MSDQTKTITVQNLIDQLQKVENKELPVYLYHVGITSHDSKLIPLQYGSSTVEVEDGKCTIDFD